jgi:hypothetical protein
MGHIYDQVIDRESAYEILEKYEERRQRESDAAMQEKLKLKEENTFRKAQLEAERLHRSEMREARLKEKEIRQKVKDEQSPWENLLETATRQVARTVTHSIGREIGRVILRGVLGGIFGGRR